MTETALWLLVLLPAVVGAALALSRLERAAAAVSLVTATVTTVLAVIVAFTRPDVSVPFMAGSDFTLGVDALSGLVVPMVAVVTLLVVVFSAGEIRESQGRFHGLMLLFAAAALVTATAQSLPALLFAWEVMGATSFALIGFWWRDDHRVSAGVTAFVTTRTADLGMYVAAGAAVAGGSGLALADLSSSSVGWRHVVAAGLLVAALGKAAQLPFSFWLSRAMEGPSPVSALLHSAAMVAMGGYLLLRIEPLLAATGWAAATAAWVGAVTALLLGAIAVAQRDLKQLLAASTSAQLGFVVMAAGLGSVSGGVAHLAAHAATKALLFLAAGAWLTALGTRRLAGLRGVARRWRLLGVTATLGALSLAGVAPLALWATKDAVLAAALEKSPLLYAVGVAAAALSAAYAGKVLVVVWRPVPPEERVRVEGHHDEEQQGTRHVGPLEQAPLVVLALGALALGLLALPPVGDTIARALGEEPLHPAPLELAVSAAIALAVLGLLWWHRRVPEPRWALAWLGLERAAHAFVVRPTLWVSERLAQFDDQVLDRVVTRSASGALATARGMATFDDRVVDGGVEATSRASLRAAERSARGDDRWLDGTVERVAAWIRGLGRLARRPQTGQLHQYYIQAVAVLAIGVLLLLTAR
ncbi:MAG: NADH-quinone oxidoreductase subunit L [Actinomycetota bacterium]|nr:NADH-quinone oxidoreductase subunit L [Actinomycetota bacterium]